MTRVLLLFIFFPLISYSQQSAFVVKADDLLVDDRCEEYKPSFFLQEKIFYFTIGIKGAKERGFNEEVPLNRYDARTLWHALSPGFEESRQRKALGQIKKSEQLKYYYDILIKAQEIRGATYNSEGEVLESLAYAYLPSSESFYRILEKHFEGETFSEEDYFLTGGVSYRNSKGRVLGELDVIVGNSKTCTIFAIGEAKLGRKKGKASKQLNRFKHFLRRF